MVRAEAGHRLTHSEQPVQSSGETWMVSSEPAGTSRPDAGCDKNPSGASSRKSGENAFMRIAACGQPSVHLPQSMQLSDSQTGSWVARPGFSSAAVPVGKVPPGDIALTGSSSPSPAISRRIVANSDATEGPLRTWGASSSRVTSASSGITTSVIAASALSIASRLACTISGPRLA